MSKDDVVDFINDLLPASPAFSLLILFPAMIVLAAIAWPIEWMRQKRSA